MDPQQPDPDEPGNAFGRTLRERIVRNATSAGPAGAVTRASRRGS